MTTNMQSYLKYSKNGPVWFGELPNEWAIVPTKGLFETNKQLVTGKSDQYLLLSLTLGGVKHRDLSGTGKHPTDYELYQVFRKNDLVICLFDYDVTPRTIGYVEENGMMTGAYTRLIPRDNVASKYYYYLYLYLDERKELLHQCTGLRNSISKPIFWSLQNPKPPYKTQKKIADFLDEKTEIIDKLVVKKEKMIELLREKRAALITQAVTKGLDPKAKMKPSGIDWLGDIPAGWKMKRAKYLGRAIIGLTYSPNEVVNEEEGILILRSSNIQNGLIGLFDNVYVKKDIPEDLITKIGDILICSRNGSVQLIGKNVLIDEFTAKLSFGAFMTIFRSKCYEFIYYFFNSNLFTSQTGLFSTSTINQLTTSILNNMGILMPPSEEQQEIVKFLKKETLKIDKVMKIMKTHIDQLKEYRSSLIYSAVTGKIKV